MKYLGMQSLDAVILWIDIRDYSRFEGQVFVKSIGRKFYFNYSVYNKLDVPKRDMVVQVVLDENHMVLEVN